ncbi:MAG: hypothetical protein ACK4IX_02610, partial [Candidatus Sericytochromatia bacterium]
MIETIKELILEPEKTKKYFLFFVNSILSIIITSKLYIIWFGKYELILFQSVTFWNDIHQFFISGRFLIVLFLFLFVKKGSDFILELLLYGLDDIISRYIGKKSTNLVDNKSMKNILSFFSVVKVDEPKKNVFPGRNFDSFYNFIIANDKESLISEIKDVKHSLLLEIYKTFLLFTIIYFFLIHFDKPLILSIFIIISILLGTFLIIVLHYYKELINLQYDEFLLSMKIIKQIDVTNKFIIKNNFHNKLNDQNFSELNVKIIEFNERVYQIYHFYYSNKFLFNNLKEIDKSNNKDNIVVIVIYSIDIP